MTETTVGTGHNAQIQTSDGDSQLASNALFHQISSAALGSGEIPNGSARTSEDVQMLVFPPSDVLSFLWGRTRQPTSPISTGIHVSSSLMLDV